MIILDTNVLSEPLKPNPAPQVVAWLDAQNFETLHLTTITLAELLTGMELLPLGRRRAGLEARLGEVLALFMPARILSFDIAAARALAVLTARARAGGHMIGFADSQIAAIAAVQGFTVATRDVGPFVAAGVAVVNPWDGAL